MRALIISLLLLFCAAAFGQWTEPVAMTPQLGTAVVEPWISNDGLRLYAAGGGYIHLITRDSVNGPWHEWQSVGNPINSGTRQESPAESPSGDTLYFMSWERPEGSYGGYDIYYSVRTDSGWGEVVNCGPNINTWHDEWSVGISRDGGLLLVSTIHPPVSGGRDLYYSEKQTDGTWGPLVNFGPNVNSYNDDEHPSMPWGNNQIYYYVLGPRMGDIWMNERVDEIWQQAVDLPAPINALIGTEMDPCISADGRTLWYIRQDEHWNNTLCYSFRMDTSYTEEPRFNSSPSSPKVGLRTTSDHLELSLNGIFVATSEHVSIHNILGREVFHGQVPFAPSETGSQGTLSIGSLSAGVYFLKLNSHSDIPVCKFVIR